MAKVEAGELGSVVKMRQTMSDRGYSVETGPIVMYFLTRRMGDKGISEIQRMIPRRDFVDKWKHLEHGAHDLAKKLISKEAATPSGAWKTLLQAVPENILFLSLTTRQQAVDQKLKNFFGKWRQVKEKLPFPEMAEMRITPQLPEYQKVMDQAFLLLLDGKLRSHTEVVNFLKPYEPPPPPPPPPARRGRGKAVAPGAGATVPPGTAPVKRGRKAKGAPEQVLAPPAAPVPAQPTASPTKAGASAAEPKKAVAAEPARKPAKIAPKKAAPAKKVAQKKAVVKRAAAKKPAKTKVAAKKTPAKKAVAKKVPAKKVPAKKPVKKKR